MSETPTQPPTSARPAPDLSSRRTWSLAALLVVAALLRLWALGGDELWLDEARTVSVASMAVPDMIESFAHDNKPPLYFLLVHFWMGVFGTSEAALRSLSAVFGSLLVLLAHGAARRLFDERAATAAAVVVALTPISIYYSQEGRNYTLAACVTLLAFASLERALDPRARLSAWTLYAAALTACLYTHYATAPIVLVNLFQVASRSWRRGRRPTWRPWMAATLAATAAFAPWGVILSRQASGVSSTLAWVAPFWQSYPPLLAIPRSLHAFLPGGYVPPTVGLHTLTWLQAPLLVGATLFAAAAVSSHHRASSPTERRGLWLAAGCVLILLLPPFLYSFKTPIYIVGRSDFVAFPAFCLLVGGLFSRLGPRRRLAAGGAFLLACAISLPLYYGSHLRSFEAATLEQIAAAAHDGDLVICTDLTRPTAEYYLGRFSPDTQIRFVSYPRGAEEHPAVVDNDLWTERPQEFSSDAEALSRLVASIGEEHRALVLFVDHPMNVPLRTVLQRDFNLVPLEGRSLYRLNQVGRRVTVAQLRRK